eukprot:scaffold26080_cov43-Cyclotella_meneghiniana.AAC.7
MKVDGGCDSWIDSIVRMLPFNVEIISPISRDALIVVMTNEGIEVIQANNRRVATAKKATALTAKNLQAAKKAGDEAQKLLELAQKAVEAAKKSIELATKDHDETTKELKEAENSQEAAQKKWEVVRDQAQQRRHSNASATSGDETSQEESASISRTSTKAGGTTAQTATGIHAKVVEPLEIGTREGRSGARLLPKLSKCPRTLHDLWKEYVTGFSGNKAAKDFSKSERGACRFNYTKRNLVWQAIAKMVNRGYSADSAIDKIYDVYGRSTSVTKIIKRLQEDKKNGGNDALREIFM